MNLSFKDVGQGDSIILTWEEGSIIKVGIIDCHRYCRTNPVLDELKQIKGAFEIEFIVISHAHRDHYSGVKEFLTYCVESNIQINNFISTLHPTQFQFLEISLSKNELKSIVKLIEMVNTLEASGVIKDMYPAYNKIVNFSIEGMILTCLYPRQSDYNRLGNNIRKYIKGTVKTKPDLNYISTIFKLRSDSGYLLLTSDCVISAIDYINRADTDLRENILQLTQVPHHGSEKNHKKKFWTDIRRINQCPAVFSVGESSHNLPDEEVVEDFIDLQYKLFSTNYVSGIKTYIENVDIEGDYSFVLDSFSELEDEFVAKDTDRFRGDKRFSVIDAKVKYIAAN